MNRVPDGRAGISTGDALIVLAILSVGAALIYPRVRLARFEDEVDVVATRVNTVMNAALAHLAESGGWPPGVGPGVVPPELAPALPRGFAFSAPDHALAWNRWEVVHIPEPPPPEPETPLADDQIETDTLPPPPPEFRSRASVSVHASDATLLSALLTRYGPATSFVRDTVWTLVMPRSSAATFAPSPEPPPDASDTGIGN